MRLTRTSQVALAAAGGTVAFLVAALAIAAGDNAQSTDSLQRRLETAPPATAEDLVELGERLPTAAPAPPAPVVITVPAQPAQPGAAGAPGVPGAPGAAGPAGPTGPAVVVPAQPAPRVTVTARPRGPAPAQATARATPEASPSAIPCSLEAFLAGRCLDPQDRP